MPRFVRILSYAGHDSGVVSLFKRFYERPNCNKLGAVPPNVLSLNVKALRGPRVTVCWKFNTVTSASIQAFHRVLQPDPIRTLQEWKIRRSFPEHVRPNT